MMKNKTLIPLLVSVFILLMQQVHAQNATIDSLKLIPTNPTTNDVIKVVCYTTFPSGSCSLNTVHAEQQGSNILLMLDYTVGMATYICHSVDTILIDNPGAGTFLLTSSITTNNQDMLLDLDTLQFTIDPYLGVPKYDSNNFLVYPNPFENELKFKSNFKVEKFEIYSISGQRINTKVLFDLNEEVTLDVSELEQGIYIINVSDPNGNKFTQRVVKHTH
jgi:hypothetical protein